MDLFNRQENSEEKNTGNFIWSQRKSGITYVADI